MEDEHPEFVIFGDFNAVINKQLDRSLYSSSSDLPREVLFNNGSFSTNRCVETMAWPEERLYFFLFSPSYLL